MKLVQCGLVSKPEEEIMPASPVFSSEATTVAELRKEIRSQTWLPQRGVIFCKRRVYWESLAEVMEIPVSKLLQIKIVQPADFKIQYDYVPDQSSDLSLAAPIIKTAATKIAEVEKLVRSQSGMPKSGLIFYKDAEGFWCNLKAAVELPDDGLFQLKLVQGDTLRKSIFEIQQATYEEKVEWLEARTFVGARYIPVVHAICWMILYLMALVSIIRA